MFACKGWFKRAMESKRVSALASGSMSICHVRGSVAIISLLVSKGKALKVDFKECLTLSPYQQAFCRIYS
jgi:hypothetical protein